MVPSAKLGGGVNKQKVRRGGANVCAMEACFTHPRGNVVAVGHFRRAGSVAGGGRHAQVHCRGGGSVGPIMGDHLDT